MGMDLGFGDILKMVEEYFGKRTTWWLLLLLIIALYLWAFGVIWTRGILPISTVILDFVSKGEFSWVDVWRNLWQKSVAIALFLLLVGFAVTLSAWLFTRRAERLVNKVEAHNEEIKELYNETVSIHNETKQDIIKAIDAVIKTLQNAGDEDRQIQFWEEIRQELLGSGEKPIGPPISDKEDFQSQ